MNTNKLVTITFAIGMAAAAGCGTDVTATASGVFPAQGFTGRSLRVEISGDQTKWKDGATVTFGDGVTVNSVEVASPTDLFADITIDPAATAGMRDVSVTSGGTFKLSQAFELVPPVELVVQGNLGQGGLPNFTLVNHDVENPFDTTTDPSTGAYTNLSISGPTGVQFVISSATELSITGQAFIDLDAAAGPLTVSSGSGSTALMSNAGSFAVTPRTPTPVSGSTTGTIAEVGDSGLYSVDATGSSSLVHITLSATDQNAQIAAGIFVNNSWNSLIGTHEILNGPATVTFVVADVGGDSGYTYTVTAPAEMLTSAAEGSDTANNTMATAPAASALPFQQTGSTVSSASDTDYFSFTISAANANKRVHLITDAAGDPNTDTAVDIVNASGTSFLQDYSGGQGGPIDGSECSLFGCLPGDNLGEDVISDMLPAGTYYVKITAGANYTTTDKMYTPVLWIE